MNIHETNIVTRIGLLVLLAIGLSLGAAALDAKALPLINQAMGADYDEAGALKIQEAAAGLDPSSQTLVKGITLHNLAWFYAEKYTQPAIDTLAAVKAEPLGEMYWGSAITIIAQYAIKRKDVGIAAAKSVEGLEIIARAMKKAPQSFQLHFLRLMNGIEISRQSPFKQYELIKEDVDFVLAAMAKPNDFDQSLKAAVWLSVGDYWFDTKKISKALGYYEKAIREAPQSISAKKAKKYLAELEG